MDYNKMSINSFDRYFLSWTPEKAELARPCYLSLANLLERDILSGKLAPGTKLPPQRELADYLDLNFTTITRAYDLCRERNLIYGIVGRGSYVSPLPKAAPDGADRKIIELGLVNGFDFIRKPVIEATKNVLKKGYLDQLYSYAEPAGHLHQRAAGVRWMAGLDVETDIAHTAVFAGAQNVISTALLSLFRLGDRIATDCCTYSNLIGTARMMHIPLVPVEGDAEGMKPEELDRLCRDRGIAGIFLMPDCADPTTVTISGNRRRELAEVIRKYGLVLIEDDHEGALRRSGSHSLCSLLPDQTVYICGSTKGLCSGLRVTFAAFPEQFRERLLGGLHHLSIKTSSLDAEIMTELINSGAAEQILKEKRKLAQKANALFDSVFPQCADPEKCLSFFRRLPLPGMKIDGMQVEKALAEKGVSVYHSDRFSVRRKMDKPFLRVSVSSAGTEENLKRGLFILRESLAEMESRKTGIPGTFRKTEQ